MLSGRDVASSEADYEGVDFGDSQLKPAEEMRPVLDAEPTPKFYEVIEA